MSNSNLLIAQYGGAAPAKDQGISNPALGETLNGFFKRGELSFFNTFLPKVIGVGYIIGVLIFFFMLITGAIQWISSGGDKQALEGAKSKLTNALIGIVILFAIFAIINVVETFFDINIMTLDISALVI